MAWSGQPATRGPSYIDCGEVIGWLLLYLWWIFEYILACLCHEWVILFFVVAEYVLADLMSDWFVTLIDYVFWSN